VKNKAHGARNPRAHLGRRGPPTLDEVLASKMIAEPLTLLQCCPTTDGARRRPRRARTGECGCCPAPSCRGTVDQRSDEIWGVAPVSRAADEAFTTAGVEASDVDVLESTTPSPSRDRHPRSARPVQAGEGAELAVSGHTALGGAQPVNPSGGLLSRGHPLGATGLAQLADRVQLRGRPATGSARASPRPRRDPRRAASGMDGNAAVVRPPQAPTRPP